MATFVKVERAAKLGIYKDPELSLPHDFDFGEVPAGAIARMPIYIRNEGDRSLFDLSVSTVADPDPEWWSEKRPEGKPVVGPLVAILRPTPPLELKPSQIYAGEIIWDLDAAAEDGFRRARMSINGKSIPQ